MIAFVIAIAVCLFSAGHVYCSPMMVSQASESSSSVQESYSSSSSSYEYSSSSLSGTNSINTALYEKAFGLASICDAEAQLYMSYLSQLPCDQISYFDEVFDYYSSQSYALNDLVVNFDAFSSEISTIYRTLADQSIYSAGANWVQQQAILQQCQNSFKNLISYVAPNSCLYNMINYINNDISSLPLVAGCCNYLVNLQSPFYSQTTSTSTTTSSSSMTSSSMSSTQSVASSTAAANINRSLYEKAFGLASICDSEAQLYMNYLAQLPCDQISYFDQVFDYYSSQSYALNDLVVNFDAFSSEISTIYRTLADQSIYSSGANWVQQQAILQQCQNSFKNLISYVAPNSCLYNMINYINTDISALPLVAGCCNYLATLQSSYYSASSSSVSSCGGCSESYSASSSSMSSMSSGGSAIVVA